MIGGGGAGTNAREEIRVWRRRRGFAEERGMARKEGGRGEEKRAAMMVKTEAVQTK